MLFFLLCSPSPFVFALSPILYCLPSISTAHVQIQIYGADTCPISPSPKSLGVIVKAEKQGSVSCRTLNAIVAAFSQIFPCLSLFFSFLILILFCGVVRCVTLKQQIVPFVFGLAWTRRSSSLGQAPDPIYTLVWAPWFVTPTELIMSHVTYLNNL